MYGDEKAQSSRILKAVNIATVQFLLFALVLKILKECQEDRFWLETGSLKLLRKQNNQTLNVPKFDIVPSYIESKLVWAIIQQQIQKFSH